VVAAFARYLIFSSFPATRKNAPSESEFPEAEPITDCGVYASSLLYGRAV